MDTFGFLIRVFVDAANVQDRLLARKVLERLPPNARLKEIRADQNYLSEALAEWCLTNLKATLTLTERDASVKGFVVQKGRWVVERTFGWFNRYRRLSKDYELSPAMSETYIYIAAIHLLLKRLAR